MLFFIPSSFLGGKLPQHGVCLVGPFSFPRLYKNKPFFSHHFLCSKILLQVSGDMEKIPIVKHYFTRGNNILSFDRASNFWHFHLPNACALYIPAKHLSCDASKCGRYGLGWRILELSFKITFFSVLTWERQLPACTSWKQMWVF